MKNNNPSSPAQLPRHPLGSLMITKRFFIAHTLPDLVLDKGNGVSFLPGELKFSILFISLCKALDLAGIGGVSQLITTVGFNTSLSPVPGPVEVDS